MTTLVLGAGGFLGLNVVEALLAAGGEPPRCGRRARGNVLALRRLGAPMVVADLDRPDTLDDAMRGCDVVIHAAGHYPRDSLRPAASLETGLRQLDHVLDAAARAGVRRVVYVSSLATEAPGVDGVYHRLKRTMEERALAEDRLEVVAACPGACLGPWDLRVGTSALLVALARGVDPPHPDGWINVVDVRDVAAAVVTLARDPSPPRRLVLAAENHRVHALLEALARRYRVAAPSAPISADDARALADAEERRAAADGGRPRLSREIVDLIVHGVVVDTGAARTALGLRWRPLDDTLDAFDAWARRMRLIPDLPSTPTPQPPTPPTPQPPTEDHP